jgi:hypothetical protein
MRLFAVSMIRNEADILPQFLGHCAALFDRVLVADQLSVDGTREMLAAAAQRMPLTWWNFAHRPRTQDLVVSALVEQAFALGADWVFPLDADEFPAVATRGDLLGRLRPDCDAGIWRWRNLWPLAPQEFARFDASGGVEALPEPWSETRKVAVARRWRAAKGPLTIGLGSHGAAGLQLAARCDLGWLDHLPVRSGWRLAVKAGLGSRGAAERGLAPPRASFHLHRMRRQLGDVDAPRRTLPPERMRATALAYPAAPPTRALPGTVRLDWRPLGTLAALPAGLSDPEEVFARDAALAWRPSPDAPAEAWRVVLEGADALLQAAPQARRRDRVARA